METEEPSLMTAGAIVEQDLDIGFSGAETLFVGQWSDLIVEVPNSRGNSAGRVVVGVEGPVECRRKRFAVLSSGGSKTIIVPVLPTAAGQSVELVLRVSYRDPENLKRQSSHRVLVPIRGRRAPGSSETL